MPEEAEVDLDALRDKIAEEVEAHEAETGGRLLRMVALTTALLAAFAAIASLQAGATINEALLLKADATQLQNQASDQWAYYQAKGIKGAIANASAAAWTAAGKGVPSNLTADADRYATQQRTIAAEATKLEHERDRRSIDAEHLLHKHHGFANAVALFQVAIALGAVTALTRSRPVYAGSLLLGVAGVGFYVWQFLG